MILLLPLMQTYRGIPCPNTGMFPFCFLIWEKVIRHGIDLHLDVIADKVLGYHGLSWATDKQTIYTKIKDTLKSVFPVGAF